MKANNYNEIEVKIKNTIAKGLEVEGMWQTVNIGYDTCMKAERAFIRDVKTIAKLLEFSIDWGEFKSSVSFGLKMLNELHDYVCCMIYVIQRVHDEFEPYKAFTGAPCLKNH